MSAVEVARGLRVAHAQAVRYSALLSGVYAVVPRFVPLAEGVPDRLGRCLGYADFPDAASSSCSNWRMSIGLTRYAVQPAAISCLRWNVSG